MRHKCGMFPQSLILTLVIVVSLRVACAQSDTTSLVRDNAAFALALYQKLRVAEGNVFVSPYSISAAFAMTYAGARGNTEKEMAQTLRFSLHQKKLHQAFAALEARLNTVQKAGNIRLSIANSLWPQKDYKFLQEYLSLIKKHYGVSITPVDYKLARETARQMINRWVHNKTQGKIQNLIRPGMLGTLTRLALVNAIYFQGNWASQFEPSSTKEAPFYVTPKRTVQAPMMTQTQRFRYANLGDLEVLELPYVGDEISMLVLLPKAVDGLQQVEAALSVENLQQWKSELSTGEKVVIFLPKFKMTSLFRLDKTLISMGMVNAFMERKANFAGMDGRPDGLYIGAVLHKAFVDVHEKGTEAAAATAVIGTRGISPLPPIFRADHPFVILIQEKQTGSILFIGRLADPTKTGE
jgi:serine protease inhibitor